MLRAGDIVSPTCLLFPEARDAPHLGKIHRREEQLEASRYSAGARFEQTPADIVEDLRHSGANSEVA